jgi:sugar phosphate isomerase/epimerase
MRRSSLGVSRDPARLPLFSVSQVSTLAASFADDVHAYVEAGVDGIGIWEVKLGDASDDEARELVAASRLGCATAVPTVPSILPLPLLPGPDDPQARIDALCASVHRLAAFEPSAVLCLTGPAGARDRDEARALVAGGLRELAAEARSAGVRLALEPFQRIGIEDWSLVNTLGEAAELIDEAGVAPTVGIQFDVWHLWNTPELEAEIERHAHRFVGVHVDDWREPTRGWADRVLPGDGVADVATILGALDGTGWAGFYDLEIFSDNGAFGHAYPNSLWDVEADELARRGRQSFTRCWDERRVAAGAVPGEEME